jgi:predicted acylesterase/phospholipase RssA
MFGLEPLLDVPISQAIAASSSIPGFFEPFRIDGRDYVDGDVGYTGHADLAVEHGATRVVVLNPAVPLRIGSPDEQDVRSRGIYAIMEQAGHITSINILQLGLRELKLRRPDVGIHSSSPSPRALSAGLPWASRPAAPPSATASPPSRSGSPATAPPSPPLSDRSPPVLAPAHAAGVGGTLRRPR